MDPMLTWTHPTLRSRYETLVELMWASGWHISIVSGTRSYEEQKDIYQRWQAGSYNAPSVADPDAANGIAPEEFGGFMLKGSLHMPQADGYSHALDLAWLGCTPEQTAAKANLVGMRLTVPGENWHFQCFPHNQWRRPVQIFESQLAEDMTDMATTVFQPDKRPGTAEYILDFPLLRAHGEVSGRSHVESTVLIRQRPASGQDIIVAVWFDGNPVAVRVGADGRTTELPVQKRGFVSVGGTAPFPTSQASDALAVEARELWLPN